ncbi:MAG TPA: protease pro-enzyme activation domain-containing protein, partial [Verrucomicrobiae bacterium]|nr:protease pro-enzyme activation domain-containing protein [Verrucomicrobiae bacterium]
MIFLLFFPHRRTALLLTAVFASLLFAWQSPAAARRTLHPTRMPSIVAKMTPLRNIESTRHLQLAICLPLRNEQDLDALLRDLQDPASTNFHRWLTPQEFTDRFGPTEADYQALESFAVSNGFKVTCRHPNRLILDVDADAATIQRAFHLTMRVYHHPTENRDFYAPDTVPTLDLPIPVLEIDGLDNYSLPKPHLKPRPLQGNPNASSQSGSAPFGAYRGNDFRAAYVPGTTLTGAGQSVGLLQFDGYYASDITQYEAEAGLPNVPLVNVKVNGGISSPDNNNSEVALDIEMVASMAPGVSAIYVYEAPNGSSWVDLLSRMANDNLARQLSCSWGGGSPRASAETVFKQMASQGQSFFNASGDSDAFTSSVAFPADSTNITQVGGTTLTTTGPGGSYVSETVWNWGGGTGSSGGISTYYKIPAYQLGISMTANQGSTVYRNIPDVALTADNVWVDYHQSSIATNGAFGGTSCAAPLWAGFTALVNQQAAENGLQPVGFLNPALYSLGKSANYSLYFHDVTTGNNFKTSSPSRFSAVTGYDLCTGWGTPGVALINALAGPPVPLVVANGFQLIAESCPNDAVDPGETVTVLFGLKNTGTGNTTNLVATLSAGGGVVLPSAPQNYGALIAGGSGVAKTFSFTADGTCGGSVTAALQLQDGAKSYAPLQFDIRLGRFAPSVTLAQNFDGVPAPALPAGWSTAAISGTSAPWMTSTSTADSAPNAAYGTDISSAGVNALVSPVMFVASSSAQLTFRHNYSLEAKTGGHASYYDGGVLEIKIGDGAFTDIITAGGSFVSGGYNCSLASSFSNPYSGHSAWGGNSGGWITTIVTLPAAAIGQNVQLRWVVATDSSNAYPVGGWYVDGISIEDGSYACCGVVTNTPPEITGQPTNVVAIAGSAANFNVTASGTAPLAYQWLFGTAQLAGETNASLAL